jgi:hypothetical protein
MEDHGEGAAFWQAPPPAPRRHGRRWLLLGGLALAFALTLGVGAFLGSALGNGQAQAASGVGQAQAVDFALRGPDRGLAGTPAPGGPGGQGQCVTLTVSSVSGSTITAKAADGSTVTIHTTSSTTYTKNHQSASASAVTVGARISVMGTRNSDGSITATSIDILG